ncbi:Trs65p KNAG_0E03710 [Huiozyma naganishii CBS 8797]|uniref:Uncharacterized protein n=1 Tax=Huiozyma naganishii (strain ATCC MYA-139 / BCRC 22969 / CBS 8797 / KCTC 17520 / NBRC 10181 / NCYC 3082 / Yp74L-3) TaxID=1071383 RepID=J7RM61_HUIN7|nr:hypothetical protein KNAG_0E03710 [Kazachstania naganishii CBS 8797]CCK70628.1 hypothetical protein KNAG_0E03710 [Kazachstania naganishii CBS 8797]
MVQVHGRHEQRVRQHHQVQGDLEAGAGDGQSIGEQGGTRDAEASREDEFLPSFEPIYSLAAGPGSGSGSATAGATADATAPATVPGDVYDEHTSVELPIYSLLNMRLRNSNLPRNTCILSSLDVQTAKAVLQLAHRHSLTNPQLVFQDVLFELVDKRGSHVALECLDDGVSKSLPQMTLTPHDSVSLVYRLPPVERAIGQLAAHRHRARVVLRYSLHTLEGHTIPIWTQWHTDITVKPVGRPLGISNNTLSRVSSLSLASTPRFHRTLESTVPIPSSSPPPMHNIRYTFLKESIQVQQCDQFILRVQITNLSPTASRDLVIYYNNHTLPDSHAAATNLTLERQATRQRRLARHAEGIVLLSNDYKLPALHPGGTHLVDLQFVAVQRGHYARLPGLKLLDLPTGDTVDIGNGASVLVE